MLSTSVSTSRLAAPYGSTGAHVARPHVRRSVSAAAGGGGSIGKSTPTSTSTSTSSPVGKGAPRLARMTRGTRKKMLAGVHERVLELCDQRRKEQAVAERGRRSASAAAEAMATELALEVSNASAGAAEDDDDFDPDRAQQAALSTAAAALRRTLAGGAPSSVAQSAAAQAYACEMAASRGAVGDVRPGGGVRANAATLRQVFRSLEASAPGGVLPSTAAAVLVCAGLSDAADAFSDKGLETVSMADFEAAVVKALQS